MDNYPKTIEEFENLTDLLLKVVHRADSLYTWTDDLNLEQKICRRNFQEVRREMYFKYNI